MKKTWYDCTWNPITGCLYNCSFCNSRQLADSVGIDDDDGNIHEIRNPIIDKRTGKASAYPYRFDPTFYTYRLKEPSEMKTPKTIYTCSAGDMFGEWVPDKWISNILRVCSDENRHRYVVLTRNPKRAKEMSYDNGISGMWVGTSVSSDDEYDKMSDVMCIEGASGKIVSFEPIIGRIHTKSIDYISQVDWVIIGSETGNRKRGEFDRGWVEKIALACECMKKPLYMKESLREIMGNEFIQETPWEDEK